VKSSPKAGKRFNRTGFRDADLTFFYQVVAMQLPVLTDGKALLLQILAGMEVN